MTSKPKSCSACPLYKIGKGFVVPSRPPNDLKLVICGEAPGQNEVEESKPFVGKAGFWMRRNILHNAGISDSTVWFDNVLRCLPLKSKKGEFYPNGEERKQAEDCCKQYDQWKDIPKNVPMLLVGNKALKRHLGFDSISEKHGHIDMLEGRVVGATYHPAAAMRQPALLPVCIRETANLMEAAADPQIVLQRPTVHRGQYLAPGTNPRAFDLEWNEHGTITVVGMAEHGGSAVSTFDVANGLSALKAHRGTLITHNGIDADLPRMGLQSTSFHPSVIFDTKIAAHIVHPYLAELGLYGLGDLVRFYSPTPDWKQDKGDVLTYNGLDCAYTYRLFEQLSADLTSTDQWHLMEKQQKLAELTRLMHNKGVKVDSDAIRRFDAEWRATRAEIAKSFPFNPNSPKQIMAWGLANGIRLNDSTFKTINRGAARHSILAQLRDYKDEGKSIRVWFNEEAEARGCIYPQFSPTGTEVARFSCSGPNCQNIPPYLRHCIIARDASCELVSWDFSQLENRCIAWLAQDQQALADFASGLDTHTMMAVRIFNMRYADVTDHERQQGKKVVHAANYCETPHHLAESLYGSRSFANVAAAKRLQDAYFGAYPAIRVWQERISRQLDSGDVLLRNPWGRVRPVYAQDSHERKKRGVHFLGCSTGADLVNQRVLDIWSELGLIPLLQVHDELVYELPRGGDGAGVRHRINEIMNRPAPELDGLVTPAKSKSGDNYGFGVNDVPL